jgi:hypothetical protein
MNASGLGPIVTQCRIMPFAANFSSPASFRRHVPQPEAADTVEKQILDFLEGRTHGEALLHALHDYVLDEPIPERMRALFQAGAAD